LDFCDKFFCNDSKALSSRRTDSEDSILSSDSKIENKNNNSLLNRIGGGTVHNAVLISDIDQTPIKHSPG
jgi:hypothetical protein